MNKLFSTVMGAIVGAVGGSVMTPINMVQDVAAPVTYPITGCVAGIWAAIQISEKPIFTAVCCTAGTTIGMCTVPFAPLIFVTRPITTPVAWTAMGATAVYFLSKKK